MPTARHACPEPGCGARTAGGRCERHQPKRFGKRSGSQQHAQVYRSRQWQRLSARVLLEEPYCRDCGAPSEQADHIVAMTDGGQPLDRDNVQGLCRKCHARKTGLDRIRRARAAQGGSESLQTRT